MSPRSSVDDVEHNAGKEERGHRTSSDESTICSKRYLDEHSSKTIDHGDFNVEKKINEPQGQQQDRDAFKVDWEENDAENPKNWPLNRKAWITVQVSLISLVSTVGSSIISPAQEAIAAYTGVSSQVAVLCISFYLLGFAFGPLIWAPLSEIWGRRMGMLPAMIGLMLFSIGVAVSQNAQSILICRFFSGFFGSAPIGNASAALADIWQPRIRGRAVSLFAVAVIGGPTIGPVIGAALTNNPHLGWRWTGYLLAIWTAATTAVLYFQFPEVYAPYLLKQKAQRMRQKKGDDRWWHPHEEMKVDIKSICTKHFTRPVQMLLTEPIVTALALYASYVYALLYMTLEVFPIVFLQSRGWGLVASTLPFLAIFVGVVGALLVNLGNEYRVTRAVEANNGNAVPTVRLPPMAIGGTLFVIGLFWFGWTADPNISWLSPVFAAVFIGAGFMVIFQQCISFLVDTYMLYAASAVSANTVLRSILAAGLPVAAAPMFGNLGVGPAMSILGGLAALALPVPFVLMKYGVKLRRMSKFAPIEDRDKD